MKISLIILINFAFSVKKREETLNNKIIYFVDMDLLIIY
jgi:hypothetical protein